MSTSEDYQGDDSSKEDMLRTHVALLKQELEQERANKKQLHHDKVREIKSVREKEQAAARDQMEAMKLKLQKEKTQELKALRDDLTKDFKTQIKSTQKAHEEELHNAKKSYKKELQALKDKYKEEVRAQVEYEMGWKFEAERKKVTHELFEMDTRLKKAEEKAANLTAADKIKGDALREKEKKHTAEMEALHKQHHLHTKKQLEELEAQKRTIVAKEKEIVQVSERLSRTQASHEKLEEELKIMRLADSWSRRSRSASPALSPSSSIDDLASSTKRERDMVIRNSELSFRVRVLEDKIASLTEDKANLQEKLAKSESQLNPLRAHITKQSHRINNLNTSLNSREKKLKQLSDDNLQLKTACQHLEEELGRKRKTLQEQMKKNSENRSKLQKLVVQNNELSTNNNSLADQVDELEELNQSLNERLSLSSLPTSPSPPSPLHISHTPLSPTPLSPTFSSPPPMSPTFSDDDLMSSISSCGLMEQLEFEKDEMQVKYEEMKNEYSDLKAKYKTLKKTHDQLQSKHRELHSHYKQVQESLELLKKEQLQLEHEVVLLRRVSQPSPFDRERHELVMEDLQEQLEERDARITELEDFIIEQDEVSRKSEEVWKKEKRQLTQLLSQKQMTTPEQMKLRKISDKPVTSAEERIAQLEENAERLREQLKDTRANSTVMDSKLKENVQLLAQTQDTVRELSDIDAALLATEKSPRASAKVSRDEGHREDEVPSTGSPLVGAQLQQYVEQCKSQLRAKEDENQALRNSLAAAQLSVSRLQSSMVALEGSTTNYNAILAEKEDTIQQLTTQLSQMDAKLTRLRRAAMPVTVSGQEHAHAVKRAIENVMSAAESGDPNALPRELAALEKALNELLKKLFPGEDLNVSPSHKQKDMKTTQPSSLEEDEVLDEGSPTPVSSDHSLSPPNILHSLTTEQTQETLSSDEVNRSPAHTPLTPSSVDQQQHGLPSLDDIPPSQPQLQTPPGSPTASHTPLMSSAMDQQQHSLPSLDDIPPSQPQLQTPPGSPTASHTPLTSSAMDQQPSTPSENTTSQPLETPPPPAIHLQESTNTPPESPPTKTSSDRPPSPTLSDDIDYPLFPPERQSRSLRPLEDSSHGDTEPSFQPTTTTTIHSTQAPPLPPPLASWESEDLNSTDSTGSLLIERGDSDFSTTPPLTTYPPDDDNDDDLLHHDEFEAPPPPPPDTFPNTITEWADLQEDTPTSLQSAPPSSTDTFEHSNAQVSQHPAMPILSSDTYPDNLYTIPTHLTEATPTLSMGTTQISTQEEAPPPPVPATPPPRPSEGTTSDNDETALSPEPPNMNLPLHNAVIQPIEEAGVQSYSPLESPVIPTPSAGGLESNRDGRDKAKMTSDLSNTFTVGTMTDELPRNEDKGHTETLTPSSPHQPQRRTRKDEMMSTLDDDGDPLTYQHHPSSKTSRGHDIPTTTASTQLSSQDSADFEEGEQTRPFSHHRNPRAPIGGSHWDTPPSNHYSEPNTSSHKTPPHVSSEPGQNESFNEAYTNMHQLPHHLHDSVMRKPPTRTQHEQPEVSPPTTNTYNHHYHQPQTQTNQSGRGSSSSTYSAPLRNGIESPSIYDDQVHSGKHRSRTPRDRRHPLHTPQQHQQLSNEGAQLHRAHQDKQRTPRDYSRSTPRQKTQLTQPQPQPQHPSQNRQYKSKQHPGGVYPGSHSNYQGSSPSSQPSAVAAAAVGGPRVFVAVMDYDPDSLCITGKPGKELAVHTGDVLAVHGEMDAMGYYSASFGNQTGLVPANFIQEMDIQDQRMRERLFNQKLSRTTTPLGTLSYASLEDTPTSWDKYTTSILLKPREIDCPRPPSQFQVEKALGHSVLLVSWQAPAMDSENRSNGCLVTGYQIYVNGETKMLVSGAKQTKALLPGLKISQPLNLGVSTSSVEGKSSEMVTITYKGRRPLSAHSSCSNTSETEPYRMFVALYDYDPAKSSPSENPEFELPLKEGELIKVFGKELSDGFLVGEINDRRGLVPANFVSEVNRVAQNKQPAGSSFNSSQQTDTEVSDGTTSPRLPATSKKMAAVFDYTPEKDSPNPNPELELSFKTGDTITVYGNMHSDGFYSGELNGEFGLVPSNFLKEIQRSTLNSSPMSTTTPTRWSHPPMTHNGDISGSVDASIFTEHDFQDMVERSTLQSSEKKATAAENERPRTHSSPVKAKPVGEQPKKKRSYRLPFRKDWIKSHKKSEPELI